MALKSDLTNEVWKILQSGWTTRNGNVVPESEDINLKNDAVKLDGTVFYADLSESIAMVDSFSATFSAEVYKCYLHCAAKIVTAEGGVITAYDGDRLMAVFLGGMKNTHAVRSALKLKYAVDEIINPLVEAQYPTGPYTIKQVVGVDTSPLFIARTGIRGSNDLVWIGRASNHAAKLSALTGFSSWISAEVYNVMNDSVKIGSRGEQMWKAHTWNAMKNRSIYASNWRYQI